MPKIGARELSSFIQKLFEYYNVSKEDAKKVADNLVYADLIGHSSHGALRTEVYLTRLDKGGAKANPNMSVYNETEISALVDADQALGSVAAYFCVNLARQKAKRNGVGIVIAKNSNHFGATSYWTDMLAKNDMMGFACTNTEALMAPPGGKGVVLGTNPISYSVPSKSKGTINYDVATSTVAQGKILDAQKRNQTIPLGWAIDENGNDTTDPNNAKHLLPFGAHKGFGLAFFVDIVSALLSGGAYGRNVKGMYTETSEPNLVSHCFIALNIGLFRELDQFKEDIDAFIDHLHETPKAEGKELFFPGEIEINNRRVNEKTGINLPEKLIDELNQIANDFGVDNLAL